MTRKDYILIARAGNNALAWAGGIPNDSDLAHREAIRLTMGFVADELGHDNPRFDREHFLAVVQGEKSLTSRPPR